jgi:hypothetical protein
MMPARSRPNSSRSMFIHCRRTQPCERANALPDLVKEGVFDRDTSRQVAETFADALGNYPISDEHLQRMAS